MENRRILAELSVEKMTRRAGAYVPARIPSYENCRFGKFGDWDVVEDNICKETRRWYLASRRSWRFGNTVDIIW